jgi:CheY-like chemotaxis protein
MNDPAKPPSRKTGSGVRRRKSGQIERASLGTVLIVDDDPGMLATLERMVARGGYDVVCMASPQLALQLSQHERPTLVLSDMDMPAMNGRELAEALKASMGPSAPPVVILTGGDPTRAECPAVAAVAHKPVSMESLLELLAAASSR